MTVLTGLRVVEVSASGAAALAARHLADWGAEVTVIEPPGGTPLRQAAPLFEGPNDPESGAWAWLSQTKRCVALGSPLLASHDEALTLAATADIVLVESELAQEVFGRSAAALRDALMGSAICVLISPFGIDGPYSHYRASDLGVNALGGWCNLIGDPGERPLRPGYDMIPRLEGICAFVASLLALRSRDAGGPPAFVEVAGQAVAASMIVAPWLMKSMNGVEQSRRANDWLQAGVMECSDGWFGCTPLTATHWEMMCHMLGMPDVVETPEGVDPAWRWAHSAELLERARPFLDGASKHDLFRQAQQWRIPGAPVEDVAERLECPQLAARGFFERIEVAGRTVKAPRVAYSISGVEPAARRPVGPAVAMPSASQERPALPHHRPVPSPLPFAGIRVLDLTHFWAGPYATSLLGAFGADVIKVESIQRPDAFRYTFAPFGADQWWERGPLWQDTNCDKRGITLDLASEEGKQLFRDLAAQSDVVISNFSNRVMANLAFDDASLHALTPRLLIVTVPGFGPGGPWEDYVGFGISFEQLAVCASITGYEGGNPRIMSGFCDPLAGMHAVAAIALALRERESSGRGAVIEVPQCEVLDSLFASEHIAVQMGAPVPRPRSNRHEWMAPHNTYRVSGDDRWISVAVDSDEAFAALCETLGLDCATDARFATAAARKANEVALDAVLDQAFSGRDGAECERALQAAGVMAARVAKGFELPADPNLEQLHFFQQVTRELNGKHAFKTWPFRIAGVDGSHKRPAPMLGEHTAEALRELLGLDSGELGRLAEHGIVGSRPLGL